MQEDIEAKLRRMDRTDKLNFLDQMEAACFKHGDIELRRQIGIWRRKVMEGTL